MDRTFIRDVKVGQKNKLQGYIENFRNKKSMAFIVLRDITGTFQVTVIKDEHPDLCAVCDELRPDSFITVEGEVIENSYVKLNGMEMVAEKIEVESIADVLPFTRLEKQNGNVVKKGNIDEAEYDLRMNYRWIDLRSETNQLMFKVQSYMVACMRNFLLERDFIEIHSPKITGAESESGAGVFAVDYFDRKGYLIQSPQFYKQMAMTSGLDRIFEVGPVFRAEKSHTSKHATEFTCFDLEFSHINSVEDVMKMEEELLTDMLSKVAAKYNDKLTEIFGTPITVPTLPFPRIKLADLYKELEERYGFTCPDEEKCDLTTEAERLCAKFSKEKYGHEFLFVTDYGVQKRPFYHLRKDGIPQGYDLIWRGCEITTGAQREHRYEILKAQAEEKGLKKDVEFYLEFFRYGAPTHGGFGLGIDRMTMLLMNLSIKDAMFIFRDPDRLNP